MTVGITPLLEQVTENSACILQICLLDAAILNRMERILLISNYGLINYPKMKRNIKYNAMSETFVNSSACKLARKVLGRYILNVFSSCSNSISHGAHIDDCKLRFDHIAEDKLRSVTESIF